MPYVDTAKVRSPESAVFSREQQVQVHLHDESRQLDVQYIQTILADLYDLAREESEEGTPLSEPAVRAVIDAIANAYSVVGRNVSTPHIASDGSGGIRLSWKCGNRELRFVYPAVVNEASYIYHQEGTQYATDYRSPSVYLADWLKWLINS